MCTMPHAEQAQNPDPFFAHVRIVAPRVPDVQRFGPFVGKLLRTGATTDCQAANHLTALLTDHASHATERWQATIRDTAYRAFDDGSALIGRTQQGRTTWWPFILETPDHISTIPMYVGQSTKVGLTRNEGRLFAQGTSAATRHWPSALKEILQAWTGAQDPIPSLDDPRTATAGTFSVHSPFPSPTPDGQRFLDTFLEQISILAGAQHRLRLVPKLLSADGTYEPLKLRGKVQDSEPLISLLRRAATHPAWPVPPTHLIARSFHDNGPHRTPVPSTAHARLTAHHWFATHFPPLPPSEHAP